MKVRLIGFFFFLCCSFTLTATPSDSIDVHHYDIHIDTLDASTTSIRAWTTVTLSPKVPNVSSFGLDLLKLNIDSIQVNGSTVTYAYNDTLLRVNTGSFYDPTDTLEVTVWYNGEPAKDPSGFGGFYFAGAYVYQLGVGFQADPHNYGRVWFPCKDNFTDKALYDVHVRTVAGKMAVCGGTLVSETDNGDGTFTWHWNLRDPIPTYLASMAVSDYIAVRDTFISISGDTIPVAIYVRPQDSTDAIGSFARLHAGFDVLEDRFGPWRWERVGYVAVPFTGGAMEHATNIAYPVITINGSLAYESLWAHELSHGWFGNLVTCDDQGEMWLNEGWASYCEAIFFEGVDGTADFREYVRANHLTVLRRAYLDDNGYWPVSGVDHARTYGTTVYSKGASVAHSLRGQMSDADFFPAVTAYLSAHAFENANSDSLRVSLEQNSGQSLQSFFDTWVTQAGFPHFEVDSVKSVLNGGNYDVTVYVGQRMKEGSGILATDANFSIRFMDAAWTSEDHDMVINGASTSQTFSLPFEPVLVMLDPDEHFMDATTDVYRTLSTTGVWNFPSTYFSANVQNVSDSLFLRATHHFIQPDTFMSPRPGYKLGNSRYWSIEMITAPGEKVSGVFSYNGRVASDGYLDHTWMTNSEDSLAIFYRPGPGYEWSPVSDFTRQIGSPVDKKGTITVDSLRNGQYTIGEYLNFSLGTSEPDAQGFLIFPNPTQGVFELQPDMKGRYTLEVRDLSGRIVWEKQGRGNMAVDLSGQAAGTYLVTFRGADGQSRTRKLILHSSQ